MKGTCCMLRRVLARSRKSRRRTLLAISSRRMLERLRKSRRRISLAISKFARHAQTRMVKRAGNRWGTRETQNMEKVSQGRPGRKEKWQVWENGSFSRYCRKNAGPEQIAALANSPTQRKSISSGGRHVGESRSLTHDLATR